MNRSCFGLASVLVAGVLVMPAGAAIVADFQFNTAGDTEGWGVLIPAGVSGGLTADGDSLNGTATNNDPQLINNSISLTLGAGETWDTVVFRVRETQENNVVVSDFNATGLVVFLDDGPLMAPGFTASASALFSAVASGDGFLTVTADISGYTGSSLTALRIDPIGGAASNSNSETNGNLFEIDFIQVNAVPEPASLALVGMGGLMMLRRQR